MVNMQWIAVEAIKPNVRNARTHSKKQIRQIADSITAFGFLVPILIDQIKSPPTSRRIRQIPPTPSIRNGPRALP